MNNDRQQLLELQLHETVVLDPRTTVLRVIGGWVYQVSSPAGHGTWTTALVFVPEPAPTVEHSSDMQSGPELTDLGRMLREHYTKGRTEED